MKGIQLTGSRKQAMPKPSLQELFLKLSAGEFAPHQKSIDPSPLRPQTTIAIEMVKTAANEAQAKVNNIEIKRKWIK